MVIHYCCSVLSGIVVLEHYQIRSNAFLALGFAHCPVVKQELLCLEGSRL
jgi:hypothetical protein